MGEGFGSSETDRNPTRTNEIWPSRDFICLLHLHLHHSLLLLLFHHLLLLLLLSLLQMAHKIPMTFKNRRRRRRRRRRRGRGRGRGRGTRIEPLRRLMSPNASRG